MKTTTCAALLVGVAFLTIPVTAQQALSETSPTDTDCAAIFSVIAEDARASGSAGADREKKAVTLYTNHMQRAISSGEQPNRNVAAQAVAVRALFMIDLLETDEGAAKVEAATAACLAGNRGN